MEAMRTNLRAAKSKGEITPDIVAQFAYLHMTDDDGRPIVPAMHHWLWLNLLCNQDIKRLLIIAPPESAKTTWLIAYLGCSIAFWPEYPRILTSASGQTAIARSDALRVMTQSEEFKTTFPDVRFASGMSNRAENWAVAPLGKPRPGRIHPSMRAMGVTGPIIGGRAREAIGDDILDEENTLTAKKREKVDNWLHRSFLSRLLSRVGRSLIIGTAWHHDDAYARIRKSGHWMICHTPLLSDTDEFRATLTYPKNWKGEMLGRPMVQEGLNGRRN